MSSQMHRLALCSVVASAMLLALPAASPAQEAAVTTSPVSVVPHLIKYAGALPNSPSKAEVVDVKFSLYAAQTGGEALWSETQQVSLDATGKYSVVLGSTTSAGVPDSVFANGQARWIGVTLGGEQESARTVLVATPYSLKASDAETLGGHPFSDFTLKNALPAGGTNITQINVGNGVTGGGTGPTVTLGLSSTYLENLGNEIYPQLTGTNTLTGKNTYTAGKLLLGTSPVLSAANVTGTSPVTATVSGNTVKIGLSDSALLTLGDSVYAQLNAVNTFSANQVVNSAANRGIDSEDTYEDGAGMYAVNEAVNASGVTGTGDFGLVGFAPGGFNYNIGALGIYPTISSEFQTYSSLLTSLGIGTGTWGDGGTGTSLGDGFTATTDNGDAIQVWSSAPYAVISAQSDYSGGASGGTLLYLNSSVTGASCAVDDNANLSCSGAYTVSNVTPDKHEIETYNVQSSENWIEDFGSSQLESGHAVVTLDPTFAKIVNTGVKYHVYLTPNGESENLYVANETATSFEVREAHSGKSAIAFDYRIVAKRAGKESLRLADKTEYNKTHSPTLVHELQAKHPEAVAKRPMPATIGGMKMINAAARTTAKPAVK